MRGIRLIAGSGRSGTTWVLDALATANDLRPVFEPLHPYVSSVGNRFAHRALTAEEQHPELEDFLARVCAGRFIGLWTKYRRQGRWLLPPPQDFWTRRDAGRTYRHWIKFLREIPQLAVASRRRVPVVKCIRANLMLDWLARGQGWRVVLIIRHPGAVIESELRASWDARFALDRFTKDERLHELTGGRYRELLQRTLTPIEALAARWVVENQWTSELAGKSGYQVVHYEHLRSDAGSAWKQILDALGLERAPNHALLDRPSQQSSKEDNGAERASRRTRWQQALTSEQIAAVQRVLDEVGCDMYSMSGPEPLRTIDCGSANAGKRAAP
jgi:hypothetical protein